MRRGFITNRLRSSKKSLEVPVKRKIETIEGNDFTWIDLQNPDRKDVEKLAEKFRAIGHPVRVKILNLLCTCGDSKLKVKTIYEKLDIDQPSISRHLNIMRKSGVLQRIQEGSNTFY